MSDLVRKRVIWFQLGEVGIKPAVVVSNNSRNRALGSAIVARITTSPKPRLPSIVELSSADPLTGRVLCDDLLEIYDEEIVKPGGTLTSATFQAVETGLMHALGISYR
jgi:mRNA interferase MazF